jgi:hypothetical protein
MMPPVQALLVTVPEGAAGWVGRWAPGIGDPTWTGWVTTVAYFVAAALCFAAHRRSAYLAQQAEGADTLSPAAARRASLIWIILTAALAFLGLNKQLDLQTLFTEVGRIVAFRQGWYQQRHRVQLAFVGVLGVAGLLGIAGMVHLARGQFRRLRLALIGAVFLIAFVGIRATSFHLVDKVLSHQVSVVRMNAILELGGIALVAVGAARNLRGRRQHP